MHTYLKSRPAWIQILLFVGMAFGIFMVLSLVAIILLSNLTGISLNEFTRPGGPDFSHPGMLFFVRGLLVVQFLGLFMIPVLLFAYFSDPRPLTYVGLKMPRRQMYFLVAVALMFVSLPLVDGLGVLNRNIRFPAGWESWMKDTEQRNGEQIEFMLRDHSIRNLVLNLIFISLFAGIGEEFFFRGVLQRLIIRFFKSPWLGIVATGFIFSAIHFQFYGFFPRFVLGIILGATYWYSGSLWTVILAHFVYDAFIIIMAHLNPALASDESANLFKESTLVIPAIISLAITVALIWWMHRHSDQSYSKVYEDDRQSPLDELNFK